MRGLDGLFNFRLIFLLKVKFNFIQFNKNIKIKSYLYLGEKTKSYPILWNLDREEVWFKKFIDKLYHVFGYTLYGVIIYQNDVFLVS